MELQAHLGEFEKRGLNAAAVSYDRVEVLRDFAARRGITFPMLSDSDSAVIRSFGILNDTVQIDSSVYGVPFPGTYLLDAAGRVTGKFFEAKYEERVTASDILARRFGAQPATAQNGVETKHLRLSLSTSARAAVGGQKIALILNVELKPGMHVYAPGVTGYKPVRWEMATAESAESAEAANQTAAPSAVRMPERLVGAVDWPAARTLHLKAIDETVPVYEKRLRLLRDFTVPSDKLLREATSAQGIMTLDGVFGYQACDARTCYNPESIPLRFELQILRHDTERVAPELRRQPASGRPPA